MELIISGAVAVLTCIYVIITGLLLKESKTLRTFQTTPDIRAYYRTAETDAGFIYIVFVNVGLGVAKNIHVEILKNFMHYDHEAQNLTNKGIVMYGKEYFYSNQKTEYYFTDLRNQPNDKISDVLSIKINFLDLNNKKYCNIINLDLKEVYGESIINPPTNYIGKIAFELNGIKKTLQSFEKKSIL